MTDFKRLPINSERLLDEILNAENPSEMLCKNLTVFHQKKIQSFVVFLEN